MTQVGRVPTGLLELFDSKHYADACSDIRDGLCVYVMLLGLDGNTELIIQDCSLLLDTTFSHT